LKLIESLLKIIRKLFNRKGTLGHKERSSTEIIFDCEDKITTELTIEKLKKRQWSHEVWHTGSRGYHISVIFSNLEDLSQNI
jgi:hypothetical protein